MMYEPMSHLTFYCTPHISFPGVLNYPLSKLMTQDFLRILYCQCALPHILAA